jgi:hypothetical protein
MSSFLIEIVTKNHMVAMASCNFWIQHSKCALLFLKIYYVGTRVINVVATFNAPKATILDQSLRLEASPSNLERALFATQLPIVTTTTWLFYQING